MSTGPKSNRTNSAQSKSGNPKPANQKSAGEKPADPAPAKKKSPLQVGAGLFIVVMALVGIGAMLAGVKLPSKGNPEYVNWIGAFVAVLIGSANILLGLGYDIGGKK